MLGTTGPFMAKEIFYSPLAQQDLDEIEDYIATELGSPIAASRTVEGILDRVDLLARFPESGTPLSSICSIQSPYRYVSANGYLAFYRVADAVYVDRVLHQKRDFLRVLLGADL